MIPLTAAETRRLFNLYTRVIRAEEFHEHWSAWRRRRQASARKSHYARRTGHLKAGGSGTGAVPQVTARFQSPPVKPCMRFSRTRLTDVLHRWRSACPRQGRKGLGGMTVPSRMIRPRRSGDSSTWVMPHPQARRRLPFFDSHSASRWRA